MKEVIKKNWFWFLLGACMYINTLGHDYVVDDLIVATKNSLTEKGVSGIPEIFSHSYLFGYDGREDESYRPLVLSTFAIERSIFGLNSSGSHFIQILLYGLLVLLLYKSLKLLFKEKEGYWVEMVVLIFAVHPIHTEVVANVKSRDELLAAIFFFASILEFLNWHEGKGQLKTILLSSTLFFLACLSKESIIPAFVIFPLIIYLKKGFAVIDIARSTLVVGIPLMLYLFIRSIVLSDVMISDPIDPVANSLALYDGFDRVIVNSAIFMKYLQLNFLPLEMSWDYSLSTYTLENSQTIGYIGVAAVLILLLLSVIGMLKRKIWGFGLVFFLVTFAATSNYFFLINCNLGERFMFLPLLGLIITFLAILEFIENKLKYKVTLVIVGLLSLFFIPRTFIRNADWKNNLSIYESGVAVCPSSIKTNFNLGTEYLEQGNKALNKDLWYDRAISSYEKCIEIYPLYPNVYENLAFVYGEKAKLAQEVALKKENFIKAESILAKAIDSLGLDKQTLFNNRYFMLDQLILIDSANNQVYFTKMIGVAEKSPEFKSDDFHRIIYAYFNLKESSRLIDRVQKEGTNYPELSNVYAEFSKKYFESGNVKEAIVLLDVYCQLNPGDLSSRSNLAMLYEMDGQLNEALVRYEAILKESPEQLHTLELYNNLKVRMKK